MIVSVLPSIADNPASPILQWYAAYGNQRVPATGRYSPVTHSYHRMVKAICITQSAGLPRFCKSLRDIKKNDGKD